MSLSRRQSEIRLAVRFLEHIGKPPVAAWSPNTRHGGSQLRDLSGNDLHADFPISGGESPNRPGLGSGVDRSVDFNGVSGNTTVPNTSDLYIPAGGSATMFAITDIQSYSAGNEDIIRANSGAGNSEGWGLLLFDNGSAYEADGQFHDGSNVNFSRTTAGMPTGEIVLFGHSLDQVPSTVRHTAFQYYASGSDQNVQNPGSFGAIEPSDNPFRIVDNDLNEAIGGLFFVLHPVVSDELDYLQSIWLEGSKEGDWHRMLRPLPSWLPTSLSASDLHFGWFHSHDVHFEANDNPTHIPDYSGSNYPYQYTQADKAEWLSGGLSFTGSEFYQLSTGPADVDNFFVIAVIPSINDTSSERTIYGRADSGSGFLRVAISGTDNLVLRVADDAGAASTSLAAYDVTKPGVVAVRFQRQPGKDDIDAWVRQSGSTSTLNVHDTDFGTISSDEGDLFGARNTGSPAAFDGEIEAIVAAYKDVPTSEITQALIDAEAALL